MKGKLEISNGDPTQELEDFCQEDGLRFAGHIEYLVAVMREPTKGWGRRKQPERKNGSKE